jgi:hypothetical protein
MVKTQNLNSKQKTLLMNAAILIGLTYKVVTGTPLRVVLVAGLVLFASANLLAMMVAKRQDREQS